MTSRDFCFWLQGFLELAQAQGDSRPLAIDAHQTVVIQQHLSLVFKHEIDPSMGGPEHQQALNDVHSKIPTTPGMRC